MDSAASRWHDHRGGCRRYGGIWAPVSAIFPGSMDCACVSPASGRLPRIAQESFVAAWRACRASSGAAARPGCTRLPWCVLSRRRDCAWNTRWPSRDRIARRAAPERRTAARCGARHRGLPDGARHAGAGRYLWIQPRRAAGAWGIAEDCKAQLHRARSCLPQHWVWRKHERSPTRTLDRLIAGAPRAWRRQRHGRGSRRDCPQGAAHRAHGSGSGRRHGRRRTTNCFTWAVLEAARYRR